MEYLIIIILCIATILILKIGMNIRLKDIKQIKNSGSNKELTKISNKFPENKQICKDILKLLKNEDVAIEETKDEKSQTSLYLVMQNKILIANIKDTFTRVQTIAHECIHSIQSKTLLKFNFIFSNFNNIYFLIICILALFNIAKIEVLNTLLAGLFLVQFIWFIVRSFLETDAMTRAEYVSKEYIEKADIVSDEEKKALVNQYKEINKIGIKLYNFVLACQAIVKIIAYCILVAL